MAAQIIIKILLKEEVQLELHPIFPGILNSNALLYFVFNVLLDSKFITEILHNVLQYPFKILNFMVTFLQTPPPK